MFPNTAIDSKLIDRLYRLAAQLERRWEGQSLPDDLDSRLIAAVLRTFHRRGRDLHPRLEREREALYQEGEILLRACWWRVAYRDLPRIRRARETGRRESVSLDDPNLAYARVPSVKMYDANEGDVPAGDTGNALLQELQRRGYAPERAWAILWHDIGLTWDDVQRLLATRMGCHTTLPQLRQWKNRYAHTDREAVRAALFDDPEDGEEQGRPKIYRCAVSRHKKDPRRN